ncbi:MAG: CBS domain-containing protein [Treponemataceae bacterium]
MNIGFFLTNGMTSVSPTEEIAQIKDALIDQKYLVVKENGLYVGILTQSDVLRKDGTIIADCLTEKPLVPADLDVGEVLNLMLEHDYGALPIVNAKGEFIGCISFDDIVNILCGIVSAKIDITFNNIVGDHDLETAKHAFLAEINHQIKNPIQGIYSALNFLHKETGKTDQEILIHSIESNVRRIDILVNDLTKHYFRQ